MLICTSLAELRVKFVFVSMHNFYTFKYRKYGITGNTVEILIHTGSFNAKWVLDSYTNNTMCQDMTRDRQAQSHQVHVETHLSVITAGSVNNTTRGTAVEFQLASHSTHFNFIFKVYFLSSIPLVPFAFVCTSQCSSACFSGGFHLLK